MSNQPIEKFETQFNLLRESTEKISSLDGVVWLVYMLPIPSDNGNEAAARRGLGPEEFLQE